LLPREEQLARKKTQIEQEKQKKEPEEVNNKINKKKLYKLGIYIVF